MWFRSAFCFDMIVIFFASGYINRNWGSRFISITRSLHAQQKITLLRFSALPEFEILWHFLQVIRRFLLSAFW